MNSFATFMKRGPIVAQSASPRRLDSDELANRLAKMVGFVALGLPVVLWLGAVNDATCMRDSISHFYYAQFLGSIFIGLLFFIGGFLVAYHGEHVIENRGSTIAGIGAFAVALFPTTDSGCERTEAYLSRVFVEVENIDVQAVPPVYEVSAVDGHGFFQMIGITADIHLIAAAIVFIYLGLFCLIALRRIIPEQHMFEGQVIASKASRNRIYAWCGIVILACVAVLFLKSKASVCFLKKWDAANLTFYVEALALWAFALAWMIKGRMFPRLNDAGA